MSWTMFQSIENSTKTDIANSAIDDVTQVKPAKADRMESFWLAETLKYFYLIFSEPELISLDDYVLYVLPAPTPHACSLVERGTQEYTLTNVVTRLMQEH